MQRDLAVGKKRPDIKNNGTSLAVLLTPKSTGLSVSCSMLSPGCAGLSPSEFTCPYDL